jgi:hypothetical protein
MAKVKIQGHASGTGVFTVTAPNSNTDRTITLPDADVTLGTDATKLPLAGGTMTGNTVHGDNVKSLFGTSSDLEIYHSGSHSFIKDNGTGRLILESNGSDITLGSVSEEYVRAYDNGSVDLYHNGVKKFETTAAGVTVTGKVAESVDGNAAASKVKLFNGQYDGTETSTITLTCGFEPKVCFLFMAITNTNCASTGHSVKDNASASHEHSLVWNAGSGGNEWTYDSTHVGDLQFSGSIIVYLDVTAWSDTTLTLTKSHVGGGTSSAVRYMATVLG